MKGSLTLGTIDTAVVVCPRPELPKTGILGVRVGGIPLLTRTLLTAQWAGIEQFTIVATGTQRGASSRAVPIVRTHR